MKFDQDPNINNLLVNSQHLDPKKLKSKHHESHKKKDKRDHKHPKDDQSVENQKSKRQKKDLDFYQM